MRNEVIRRTAKATGIIGMTTVKSVKREFMAAGQVVFPAQLRDIRSRGLEFFLMILIEKQLGVQLMIFICKRATQH